MNHHQPPGSPHVRPDDDFDPLADDSGPGPYFINPRPKTNGLKPEFNPEKRGIGSITPARVIAHVNEIMNRAYEPEPEMGLLEVRTFDEWMDIAKDEPIPKMLFSEFWHEGELCILFADTNLGKSVLGVQIGNSIGNGKPIQGFKLEAEMQPVIYCDFEMAKKQLEVRYTANYQQHFRFGKNFFRAEIRAGEEPIAGMDYEEYLCLSIERAVVQLRAKILIIDNITYLRNETEKARDALPLMKELKALKTKYNLSILAMAHTPKRDKSKPITKNDLQGSKMLINFCDSAFAIGEDANNNELRYLKQIKQRNTSQIYGEKNVCICIVNKPHNFLQYEFKGFGSEYSHLRDKTDDEEDKLLQQVTELHGLGKSLREIGTELGISYSKAGRMLRDAG